METQQHTTRVRLDTYNNTWYNPGAGFVKRTLWYLVNALFFINPLNPSSALKVYLLRLFGATVGKGVVLKPAVNIKYPWFLHVGQHVWVGEKVWVDNLATIKIGNHVTLSQGAMLLTGSHDYKKPGFDLKVEENILEDGVWIGAGAMVCPGVTCASHSVLAAGSVAVSNLEPYTIYQGNPATPKRRRAMESN